MTEVHVKKVGWEKFGKTVIIWMAFFIFGLCDCVRGPTILDMQDILGVEISEISLIFTFFSMGSLVGCILSSLILDKLKKYRFLVLGSSLLLLGLSTAFLPHSHNLPMAYCVSILSGFSSGVQMTGGNVPCANMWKGSKHCSSFVHANQFAWSLGAVLAPISAKPFLTQESKTENGGMNTTFAYIKTDGRDPTGHYYSIKTLYPILGSLSASLFICFILAHYKDGHEALEEVKQVGVSSQNSKEASFSVDENAKRKVAITGIITCFLFLAIGSEVVFR